MRNTQQILTLLCIAGFLFACSSTKANFRYSNVDLSSWTDQQLCASDYRGAVTEMVRAERARRALACNNIKIGKPRTARTSNAKVTSRYNETDVSSWTDRHLCAKYSSYLKGQTAEKVKAERARRGLACNNIKIGKAQASNKSDSTEVNVRTWTYRQICGSNYVTKIQKLVDIERSRRGIRCPRLQNKKKSVANNDDTARKTRTIQSTGSLQVKLENRLSINSRIRIDKTQVFSRSYNQRTDMGSPLLVISASELMTEVKEVSSRIQSSSKKTGTRQVPNPSYTTALNAYNTALALFSSSRPSNCLGFRPCTPIDLAMLVRHNRLKEAVTDAERKLNRTPPYKTVDLVQQYQYRTVEYRVTKTAPVRIAKFEAHSNSGLQGRKEIRLTDTFTVAYGFSPEDTNKQKSRRYANEVDIENYERAPIDITDKLRLASISWAPIATRDEALAWMSKNTSSTQPSTIASSTTDVSVTADKRFNSVVVVNLPSGGLGTGFYVARDVILTAEHVVGDTRFVKLVNYKGEKFDGRVIDRDSQRDLALISTKKAGTPLQIFKGDLQLGSTVEAIGHPKGYSYSITRGVISALRLQSTVVGSRLARQVEFVQSDTPISNGNSGGPLLLGEKVVGVASWIRVDKGSQNLNFSVSANEISTYLAENRIGTTY